MKAWLACLACATIGVSAGGWINQGKDDLVVATRILLRDKLGKTRVVLSGGDSFDGPSMRIHDSNDKARLIIGLDNKGELPSITLCEPVSSGASGTRLAPRAVVCIDANGTASITTYDQYGRRLGQIHTGREGQPTIRVTGGGKLGAELGCESQPSQTRVSNKLMDQSATLRFYDESGSEYGRITGK